MNLAAASALPQLSVGMPRRRHPSRAAAIGEMQDDAGRSLMRGLSSGSAAAGVWWAMRMGLKTSPHAVYEVSFRSG
jgi:hypothetical protein